MLKIRNEQPRDYRAVEELTRKAFWNLYSPGCTEHYVAHVLRDHKDFIPELDLVLEVDGVVVANIMYTKSVLRNESGIEKEILTFGPLSVHPEYQRRGYGKMLMEHSFEKAVTLGYDGIVIFGNPENYITSGFRSSKRYNIFVGDHAYPVSLLVRLLGEGIIPQGEWQFHESDAFAIDSEEMESFDKTFPPLIKGYQSSQELFYIHSHGRMV